MTCCMDEYLRIRLSEQGESDGDHPEYGQVFGIVEIDSADVGTAALEYDLAVDEGLYWAVWYDSGAVYYRELRSNDEIGEAVKERRLRRADYEVFCAELDEEGLAV